MTIRHTFAASAHRTRLLLCALAVTALPGVACAADEKWEVTARVELSGIPFRMPATTAVLCVEPGKLSDERIVSQDGCSVGKVTKTGSTSRFAITCTTPYAMSGEAEVTRQGNDAYAGSLQASGVVDGRKLSMKATYAGRRIGHCEEPAAAAEPDSAGTPAAIEVEGFTTSDPAVTEGLRQWQQVYEGKAGPDGAR